MIIAEELHKNLAYWRANLYFAEQIYDGKIIDKAFIYIDIIENDLLHHYLFDS